MRRPLRSALALLFVPAIGLAACDGDNGSGPRLTADEVSGAYNVCALAFTPTGGVPPALDLRAKAIQAGSGTVELNQQRNFQLVYRRPSDGFTTTLNGTYTLGNDELTLAFADENKTMDSLLLPRTVVVDFEPSPKALNVTGREYTVDKADYERLQGQEFPAIRDEFSGTLSGRFTTGACG